MNLGKSNWRKEKEAKKSERVSFLFAMLISAFIGAGIGFSI